MKPYEDAVAALRPVGDPVLERFAAAVAEHVEAAYAQAFDPALAHDWAANYDAQLPLVKDYCRRCRCMRFGSGDVCPAQRTGDPR